MITVKSSLVWKSFERILLKKMNCKTCLSNPKVKRIIEGDYVELSPGTHLAWWTCLLGYWHHAIYVGRSNDHKIRVIHGSCGRKFSCTFPRVREEEDELDMCCAYPFQMDYTNLPIPTASDETVLESARTRLGEFWSPCTFNCEHFAVWAKTQEGKIPGQRSKSSTFTYFKTLAFLWLHILLPITWILLIESVTEKVEQSDDQICQNTTISENKASSTTHTFEVVSWVLVLLGEFVYLIFSCHCCCACKMCFPFVSRVIFPLKIRLFFISATRAGLALGLSAVFDQMGENMMCDSLRQIGYPVLGSFLGATSGTMIGFLIGNWIAFLLESCIRDDSRDDDDCCLYPNCCQGGFSFSGDTLCPSCDCGGCDCDGCDCDSCDCDGCDCD